MPITITGNTEIGGAAVFVSLNPKATFLRTNNDPSAVNAIAVDLAALGFSAGDLISMEVSGDYDHDGAGPGPDASNSLLAVFSTSATLLANTNLNRVSGAVAAIDFFGNPSDPVTSGNTASGNLATNIAQDFELFADEDSLPYLVPTSATHIFFSVDDNGFGDNSDPDADFGINIFRPMGVGIAGTGTLTMTGGSEVSDGVLVGSTATGNGTLNINGGAQFNIGGAAMPDGNGVVDGNLVIGVSGIGVATISGGADVFLNQGTSGANFNGGFVGIGLGGGSTGTLTVTGAGTSLSLNGEDNRIAVGSDGTATLNVQASAVVNAQNLDVAWRNNGNLNILSGADVNLTSNAGMGEYRSPRMEMAGSANAVAVGLISGTGSTLNITQVGASAPGNYGPQMVVGIQGDATLTVASNAQVNISGEDGRLIVSGAWSWDDINPTAPVAQSEVIIQSGADVTINNLGVGFATVIIGDNQFGNGKITVTGTGSTLTSIGTRDEIVVGGQGTGVLDILAGGDVIGQKMFIGADQSSNGTVNVDGAGSTLTLAGAATFINDQQTAGLWVGNRGTGTMTVSNSAIVSLTGDSAQIQVGDGYAGSAGTGVLNIQSGGVVTVNQGSNSYFYTTVTAGQNATATGTINITGSGSKLVSLGNKNSIDIGNRGTGILNITAGADLEGKVLRFGDQVGSSGTGLIDGIGTTVTLVGPATYDPNNRPAQLLVGQSGDATVTVSNGATVSVSGDNAELIVGANFDSVVGAGAGVLNILSGGIVTVNHGTNAERNGTVKIGNNELSTGTINVSGTGSQLVSIGGTNEIVVGESGNGTLNVLAGGVVSAGRIFVGMNETSNGTLLVDGATSAINLSGPAIYAPGVYNPSLTVGNRGNGTATIRNGAQVNITGGGAQIQVGDGYALTAPGASGTLTIESGADVTVTNTDPNRGGGITIGSQPFGQGTVNVTGVGSTMVSGGVSPWIGVGNRGTGVLNISAGGVVKSLGMGVGEENGSAGDVNILGAGSKLILSNDTHTSGNWGDNYGGFLQVGRNDGSSGRVDVSAGGVLEIRNTAVGQTGPGIVIADQQGSVGIVTVDGTGSAINVSMTGPTGPENSGDYGPFMTVGRAGDGTLIASNNAQINLTGASTFIQVGRGNDDGQPGAPPRATLSEFNILSGADVNITALNGTYYGAGFAVGSRTNGNGSVLVDGIGSTLNVIGNNTGNTSEGTAFMIIGRHGQGAMTVQNGADVLIDGGDDRGPHLFIGQNYTGIGALTVSGVGSSLTLATTNTSLGGGGIIEVARSSGSSGILNIENGAQVINDLNSTNSATIVGRHGDSGTYSFSDGSINIDGNGNGSSAGNAATLFDAGQLLVIGAGWTGAGSTLTSVTFTSGGYGSVRVSDNAILRANLIAVGTYGTIAGNASIEGNIQVEGGSIGIVDEDIDILAPGKLTVTGSVNVNGGRLGFVIAGTTAVTQYSQIAVSGAVTVANSEIIIDLQNGFTLTDGNSFTLIDGGSTFTYDAALNYSIVGANANQAYLIGDTGSHLIFEALNTNGVGSAVLDFGSTSTNAVTATLDVGTGFGTGSGGRFDAVTWVKATGLNGTAAIDNLTIIGAIGGSLGGNAGNDILTGGAGDDVLNGGAGGDTLSGGANGVGGDTLDYTGSTNGVIIDLHLNTALGGHATGDVISGFENVKGTNALDIIVGNADVNVLDGAGGVTDTLQYLHSTVGVNVNLKTNVVSGGHAQGDTILNFERVTGSSQADTLRGSLIDNLISGGSGDDLIYGDTGNDTLNGNNGNDTLFGGVGADIIDGGGGSDTVSFIGSTSAVTINLLAGTGSGGEAQGDTYALIENVIGSSHADTVIGSNAATARFEGNGGADNLTGGTGADTFVGGTGGDTMNGLGGVDRANYSSSTAVNINLLTNTHSGGEAAGDSLLNIEEVSGSGQADIITGDGQKNHLLGQAGADRLNGGVGADTLTGGTGSDSFVFNFNESGILTTTHDFIADYTKGAVGTGDEIDAGVNLAIGGSTTTATATQALVNATTGVTTFASGSGTTLADALNDIATSMTTGGNTAGEFAFFRVANTGSMHMFISDGVAGVGAGDVVVRLTSVTTVGSISIDAGDVTILT